MNIAAIKDQSLHKRGMFQRMVDDHPADVVECGASKVRLVPYQQTQTVKLIKGRNNIIGVISVEAPDSIRSYTTHLLHLSEYGIWESTPRVNAEIVLDYIAYIAEIIQYMENLRRDDRS